jgi:toluene monooxygenase system protein E
MTQRTYWHLGALGRKPNDYDIATSKLLYYPARGFETQLPIADWFRRYQRESPLQCSDWEQFRDPRETTYTTYTELQRTKEAFVDGVLQAADDNGHDRALTPAWLATLAEVLPVLRYPAHGLQMIAAYIGQMAPSGRIVVAGLFQAADELRRVQRIAYRMRQLQEVDPEFGARSREAWESAPRWQPLRELIERLLVTYDWGEAFVALCFAVKPRFDELFATRLGELARRSGDAVLGNLVFSLDEDCRWHRDWSRELVRMAIADRPANREPIETWLAKWNPLAIRAAEAFAPILGERDDALYREHCRSAGLS